MKRFIAGLACAAAAGLAVPTLASAAHAQAPADPLAALQSKLGAGRGVSFSDKTKLVTDDFRQVFSTRTGVLQFGRSGVAASDHTTKLRIKASDLEEFGAIAEESGDEDSAGFSKMLAGLAKPERTIQVKNVSYLSGGVFGEFLPSGKTWLRFPGPINGVYGSMSQLVNPAEPATLKALLAHAVKQTGGYTGKITFGELYKVSPWFRASMMDKPSAKAAKTVVTWRMAFGADRLPTRLTTTYASGKDTSVTVETDYSGWGAKVSVKAPPADEVAEVKDLEEGASETAIPLVTK
ncbi:hypothetical protein [Planomonospora parontospora]|uniref:hypothetical protein n=1 Tax=Planomonospora parontospora TaxID=58119 RepID=UPI001670B90F|nr:hypothetical protein [Planomonospora parontospora]GGL05438.1 hypothetical protein GCM10014719_04610 [Planomonospora parontospora subsp. antibiotica]GII14322.1 hypothetical protein Ppa05_10480 [Planomonospora parontospora subsp. antibiotica]